MAIHKDTKDRGEGRVLCSLGTLREFIDSNFKKCYKKVSIFMITLHWLLHPVLGLNSAYCKLSNPYVYIPWLIPLYWKCKNLQVSLELRPLKGPLFYPQFLTYSAGYLVIIRRIWQVPSWGVRFYPIWKNKPPPPAIYQIKPPPPASWNFYPILWFCPHHVNLSPSSYFVPLQEKQNNVREGINYWTGDKNEGWGLNRNMGPGLEGGVWFDRWGNDWQKGK